MLFINSKKAQRVSWSTSHSETNPGVSCAAMANLVASRFTELDHFFVHGYHASARHMLEIHTRSLNCIPVDLYTDAMNLFELICYSKSLPNGNHHRVGILELREDRLTRRLRHIIHVPTRIMLADQLTKRMTSEVFMYFITTGLWNTIIPPTSSKSQSAPRIRIRRAARRPTTYTEQDLIHNDFDKATNNIGDDLHINDDINDAIAPF